MQQQTAPCWQTITERLGDQISERKTDRAKELGAEAAVNMTFYVLKKCLMRNWVNLSKIYQYYIFWFFSSVSLLDALVLSFTEPSLKISPNPIPRIFFGCVTDPGEVSFPFPWDGKDKVGPVQTVSERIIHFLKNDMKILIFPFHSVYILYLLIKNVK